VGFFSTFSRDTRFSRFVVHYGSDTVSFERTADDTGVVARYRIWLCR